MSGLLGSVYSFGDSLKRKVRGLLSDPLAQIQLNMNQAAGGFNDAMRSPATDYARAGGVMADDPSTQAAIRAEADRRIGALMNVMPGGLLGATVWHGSPHKFAKFDASKIGTGEGAQAYGHGLYLAEGQDVAKTYAIPRGVPDVEGLAYERGLNLSRDARIELMRQANSQRNSAEAARMLQNASREARTLPAEKLADTIEAFRQAREPQLYKVDLPDPMIARMLDWDKPLSQQAPDVRALLQASDRRAKDSLYQNGGEYYRALMSRHAQNAPSHLSVDAAENMAQAPASQQLRALGIPGIRYLDGGSRGAGSGTSNFVVFPGEEGLLTILERNGVPLR